MHSSDPGDHIDERMVLGDKQKQLQRQTKAYDDTAIQVDNESSYGFLEAFTNRLIQWWTNHVAKLDNSDAVHLDKEHDIREVSSSASTRQGQPDIASKIHSSFMSLDQGQDKSSSTTTMLHSSDPGDHIEERMVVWDKQKQHQRQTKAYDDTAIQVDNEQIK